MFLSGIVIHELGHLIGGLIAGYHFYYIEFFGFYFIKTHKHWCFTYRKKVPLGQCMMYHEDIDKCPIPLIVGGLAANMLIAVLGTVIFISAENFIIRLLFTVSGIANLSLVFMNVFGSETSDGRTLKEVILFNSGRLYNEIMLIDRYIGENRDYKNVPCALTEQIKNDLKSFYVKKGSKSSLAKELEFHLKRYSEQEKNGFVRKDI